MENKPIDQKIRLIAKCLLRHLPKKVASLINTKIDHLCIFTRTEIIAHGKQDGRFNSLQSNVSIARAPARRKHFAIL